MDPYGQPRQSSEQGCCSFSCGCCSGGCLGAVLLLALATLVFVYGYWVGMVEHPGEFAYVQVLGKDMSATILPGDWVLVDRSSPSEKTVQRGDIVWFLSPQDGDKDSKRLLRVAGLPNESITYNASGELMINNEPFNRLPAFAGKDYRQKNKSPEPVQLKENQFYLLGDNRSESVDSRAMGPVEIRNLRGSAVSILFPPNRVNILRKD